MSFAPDPNEPEPYGPDPYGPRGGTRAADRTNLPGIFLIVVSILNLLGAVLLGVRGVQLAVTPVEVFEEQLQQLRKMSPMFAGQAATAADMKTQSMVSAFVGAGLGAVVGVLSLLAGIRMRVLRNYALAVTGSVLAALPCLSCMSCCGLGEGIGIWALVVLLDQEVRAAFR
jgi:hypothetical protein